MRKLIAIAGLLAGLATAAPAHAAPLPAGIAGFDLAFRSAGGGTADLGITRQAPDCVTATATRTIGVITLPIGPPFSTCTVTVRRGDVTGELARRVDVALSGAAPAQGDLLVTPVLRAPGAVWATRSELPHAVLESVTVPRLDTASADDVPLTLTFRSDLVATRAFQAQAAEPEPRELAWTGRSLAVTIGGRQVRATSAGPFTVKLNGSRVEPGNLELGLPAGDPELASVFGTWFRSADPRQVVVSVDGLKLTLDGAGVFKLEAPRLGTPSATLFAEQAALDLS